MAAFQALLVYSLLRLQEAYPGNDGFEAGLLFVDLSLGLLGGGMSFLVRIAAGPVGGAAGPVGGATTGVERVGAA